MTIVSINIAQAIESMQNIYNFVLLTALFMLVKWINFHVNERFAVRANHRREYLLKEMENYPNISAVAFIDIEMSADGSWVQSPSYHVLS